MKQDDNNTHTKPPSRKGCIYAMKWLAAILLVMGFIAGMYIGKFSWTGFVDYTSPSVPSGQEFQRGKTLWDWLDLLIVPVVLGSGAYLFNKQQQQLEQQKAEQQKQAEDKQTEGKLQETVIDAYIDRFSDLLLNSSTNGDSLASNAANILRLRTLAVLNRLDGTRKTIILQLLFDAGLLHRNSDSWDLNEDFLIQGTSVINLEGANLREINLEGDTFLMVNLRKSNLENARLRGTSLLGSDLRGANLRNADLRDSDCNMVARLEEVVDKNIGSVEIPIDYETSFEKAILLQANLANAQLQKSNLSNAKLNGAILYNANLEGAKLVGTDLTGADLRGTDLFNADLQNAILTDISYDHNTQWPEGFTPPPLPKSIPTSRFFGLFKRNPK